MNWASVILKHRDTNKSLTHTRWTLSAMTRDGTSTSQKCPHRRRMHGVEVKQGHTHTHACSHADLSHFKSPRLSLKAPTSQQKENCSSLSLSFSLSCFTLLPLVCFQSLPGSGHVQENPQNSRRAAQVGWAARTTCSLLRLEWKGQIQTPAAQHQYDQFEQQQQLQRVPEMQRYS